MNNTNEPVGCVVEVDEESLTRAIVESLYHAEYGSMADFPGYEDFKQWLIWEEVGYAAEILTKRMLEYIATLPAAAGADKEDGWLPIESAPKDGLRILAFFPGRDGVVTVKWDYYGWALDPDGGTEFAHTFACQPTYWRPLPTPPVVQHL